MDIFTQLSQDGHEQLLFCNDPNTSLKAIICIHNSILGPAIGGIRLFPYPTQSQALDDVLRLSRAMTYKSALAGLDLGGGKRDTWVSITLTTFP